MKPHNNIDTPYLMLLNRIRNEGNVKSDRTNTGTVSLFGNMIKLDVRDGYIPLLTTKKIFYESFIKETVWFISGSTDVKFLKEQGVGIWDEWVIPETSKWRPYTPMEYGAAYQRRFKGDWDDSDQVPGISFKDAYNWLRCHEPALYKEYRKLHPQDANQETLDAFVKDKVTIPNMKLVSGSIGKGAYGSLWRDWEDTRIIESNEYEAIYKPRGYKLVSPCLTTEDGRGFDYTKAVITRSIDQLQNVIDLLIKSPDSRRIILSAWNPGRLEDAVLPPCHNYSQYFSRLKTADELTDDFLKKGLLNEYLKSVTDDQLDVVENMRTFAVKHGIATRYLSSMMINRSSDFPVGNPFNIPQYVLLLNVIANIVGMDVEEFTWVGADTHIYHNQLELVKEQISRTILPCKPKAEITRKLTSIDDLKVQDISITGYESHPAINYPVAV